jgi:hypothetical protein
MPGWGRFFWNRAYNVKAKTNPTISTATLIAIMARRTLSIRGNAPTGIFVQAGERRALLDSETLDRELGYLRRLFDSGLANLDDLLCDHLGQGIVAVHKRERA